MDRKPYSALSKETLEALSMGKPKLFGDADWSVEEVDGKLYMVIQADCSTISPELIRTAIAESADGNSVILIGLAEKKEADQEKVAFKIALEINGRADAETCTARCNNGQLEIRVPFLKNS